MGPRSLIVALVSTFSILLAPAAMAGPNAEGTVTGDRVHLRAGPSTNDASVGFASKGDRLTILSTKAGWYQVRCPGNASVYIHSKYVSESGTVTGSTVNLRATPNTDHSPIGKTRKGDRVQVIGNTGEWVKIKAPTTTAVWIHSDYVQVGAVPGRRLRTAPAGAQGMRRPPVARHPALDVAQRYLSLEKAKEPEAMDLEPAIRLFKEAMAGDASDGDKALAAAGLKEAERWQGISEVMREVNRPLQPMPVRTPYPPTRLRSDNENDYLAVGWVKGRGRLLFGGASHRLHRGEETIYLLKSEDFRLNDFVGKRVGIRGTVVGWEGSRKVVQVEDIHIFRS